MKYYSAIKRNEIVPFEELGVYTGTTTMEESMEFILKTKYREQAYNPEIPLLGIYLEKPIPMFIATLFTIVRTWKQPKCPSTGEWIKEMWCIYTMNISHKKRMK